MFVLLVLVFETLCFWCLQSFLKHLADQAGLNLAQYIGTGTIPNTLHYIHCITYINYITYITYVIYATYPLSWHPYRLAHLWTCCLDALERML